MQGTWFHTDEGIICKSKIEKIIHPIVANIKSVFPFLIDNTTPPQCNRISLVTLEILTTLTCVFRSHLNSDMILTCEDTVSTWILSLYSSAFPVYQDLLRGIASPPVQHLHVVLDGPLCCSMGKSGMKKTEQDGKQSEEEAGYIFASLLHSIHTNLPDFVDHCAPVRVLQLFLPLLWYASQPTVSAGPADDVSKSLMECTHRILYRAAALIADANAPTAPSTVFCPTPAPVISSAAVITTSLFTVDTGTTTKYPSPPASGATTPSTVPPPYYNDTTPSGMGYEGTPPFTVTSFATLFQVICDRAVDVLLCAVVAINPTSDLPLLRRVLAVFRVVCLFRPELSHLTRILSAIAVKVDPVHEALNILCFVYGVINNHH